MKTVLIMMVCLVTQFSGVAFGLSSSDGFTVSGFVPVTMQVLIFPDFSSQDQSVSFTLREISNNREGYKVVMETDAVGATYNGVPIAIVNGQATLTHVTSQSESIDTLKKLKLSAKPSFIRINIFGS